MKRRIWNIILILAFIPMVAFAQPPEELPVDETEENFPMAEEGYETIDPVPESAPVAQPIAAPVPVPAADPDDDTVRGVTLSPSLGVYPIGFDGLNISASDSEGKRFFLQLQPGLSVDSLFKTAGGRKLGFNLTYTLIYREYFNKGATFRDIENDLEGTFNIDWTDRLNMSMYILAGYYFKVGADTNEDNAIFFDITAPKFSFKANDQINFGLGLWGQFVEVLNSSVGDDDLNPPGDLDDIRRGDITASAYDYASPFASGTYLGTTPNTERFWFGNLGVRSTTGWTPIEGTSVGMDYRFVFDGYSNKSSSQWWGHYIKPSVSQAMPWPGGKVSLSNELRLRVWKSALAVDDMPNAKQDFRNRLTLSVSQAITDFMSFTAFYRWQMTGNNSDDYSSISHAHWFYTGVNFSF